MDEDDLNRRFAEMNADLTRKFAEILAQLTTLQLIANEALSVALYHDPDPDEAVAAARRDINHIIDVAKAGPNAEFADRVRSLVTPLLDAIEKRVSQLKHERTLH
jgi:hypothetical protein